MTFDSSRHHRRSIRLKSHDYGGGGCYFVTLCANRAAGNVFAPEAVRTMVARVWQSMPERFPGVDCGVGAGFMPAQRGFMPAQRGTHEGCPYTVMPDHFHALIRIAPGVAALGDVVGAFKSLVVHAYVAGAKSGMWPASAGAVWHRNYYERIVRDPEEGTRIADYIRMNPWRLEFQMGGRWRGIGNPVLWETRKTAFLCSRNCPEGKRREALAWAETVSAVQTVLSGFHSPVEQEVLAVLLKGVASVVYVPACSVARVHVDAAWLPAVESGRVLIASPFQDAEMTGELALQRNRYVLERSDDLRVPHATPGGALARVLADGGRLG